MGPSTESVSIVIPAKNEAEALSTLLPRLNEAFGANTELIVVNDGSTDATAAVAADHGARVITHPYSIGNGGAIKAGARAATGEHLVCMDADGQHRPEDAVRLLAKLDEGYDMAVGARGAGSQANLWRLGANGLYSWLATRMVGHRVEDLTSGFRAVKREKFLQFLFMLPNGFSYPSTVTMAFFRSGYPLAYVPITAERRSPGGKSHIKLARDGVRFLLVIFRITTLYSPLKLFAPAAGLIFGTGLAYYLYTYLTMGRFTNMGTVLLLTGAFAFLVGLISEQMTLLLYQGTGGSASEDDQ